MKIPKVFLSYQKEAAHRLGSGAAKDLEFAGGTYQVQVDDFWAFVQLNSADQLQDFFCSCEDEDENGACVHLATAWMKIFEKKNKPLHLLFDESLWNILCALAFEKYGEDPKSLKKLLNTKQYKSMVQGRELPTPETSLLLSSLTEEEIEEWREGEASAELNYRLSFWGDLAKQLFKWQIEGKAYTIDFQYGKDLLPDRIQVLFPSLSFEMPLEKDELIKIIPTLNSVKSPLFVNEQVEIEKAQYVPETRELLLWYKADLLKQENVGVEFEQWDYLPKAGFVSRNASQERIEENQIAHFLDKRADELKDKLENTVLHTQPVPLLYSISFDSKWNLHLLPYVKIPEDLLKPHSHSFGQWAFIENEGFFPVLPGEFGREETVISKNSVAPFVTAHRTFLNMQRDFEVHLAPLITSLTYEMTRDDQLVFLSQTQESQRIQHDFGGWIYIEGEGFYPSDDRKEIYAGLTLTPPLIPLFIQEKGEELKQIPGFFAKHSPVVKASLTVHVRKNRRSIHIDPSYEFEDKPVKMFGDYTYVEGEGFSEIPSEVKLPNRFAYPVEIPIDQLPEFLSKERETLDHLATFEDPIDFPTQLDLHAAQFTESEGVYEMQFVFKTDTGEVKAYDVFQAISKGQKLLLTDVGLLELKNPIFQWMRRIDKKAWNYETGSLSINLLELLRLQVVYECGFEEGQSPLRTLLEKPIQKIPEPEGLLSVLRPYQKEGLHFLFSLWRFGLSALLCDEMGLGKTHQAMALIASVRDVAGGRFLVVCPTTVIFHWEEKITQFFPGLRVLKYHGQERSIEGFAENYDLLLTSYGVWRRDFPFLRQQGFEVAVFDEIHSAKNQATRLHASLVQVKAKMKVGLTGTPIENNLFELKAIFDLILPGLMPHSQDFKRQFVVPIEKQSDQGMRDKLAKLVSPFLLRRTKNQVLLDLPEKSEEVAHCTLSEMQQVMYRELILQRKEALLHQLHNREQTVPYMHIFALFSSLKQICNHPGAYLKTPKEYKEYTSGKWDLFCELLSEALDSGQKVVVFTQYLSMLDIMELYAKELKVSYATIRGSTKDRGAEIKRFNEDPDCQLFFGSLGAAGTGIDLTSGSVVIHYDRWWNKAKENQATDRVHRIGQTRGVQIFKLMTKNTVEERIDQLIRRKGRLMEEVIGVDDQGVLKTFKREELIELLEELGEV
ncbi:MAG: DEAD/DEAH box helicase [Waddliaceae bacterium]